MEGFKISSHEYVEREFCLVATDASMMFHCMIKLPCEMQDLPLGYQKRSEWLTLNFHGFSWDSTNGYTVTRVRRLLTQLGEVDAVFFCKGMEKVQWIRKLIQVKSVKDANDEGCPSLSTFNFNVSVKACTYHVALEVNAIVKRNCLQLEFCLKLER